MTERPYVLVSVAMSVDGYIDDCGAERLVLSGDADLDRVDEVRAGCDAIMVGAATIRRDDPRLVIRSAERRSRRVAAGLPDSPAKVTVTASGNLPATSSFFTTGSSARLVYCARAGLAGARARLSGLAEVIDAGDAPSPTWILADLARRGVTSLLLEGGGRLASSVLGAGLADELHLVVAPFFVGDERAPRFAMPGVYPNGPTHRMRLAEVRPVGDVILLRYLLSSWSSAETARGETAGGTAGAAGSPMASGAGRRARHAAGDREGGAAGVPAGGVPAGGVPAGVPSTAPAGALMGAPAVASPGRPVRLPPEVPGPGGESLGELAAAAGRLLGQMAGPSAGSVEKRIRLLRGMIQRLDEEGFEPRPGTGRAGAAASGEADAGNRAGDGGSGAPVSAGVGWPIEESAGGPASAEVAGSTDEGAGRPGSGAASGAVGMGAGGSGGGVGGAADVDLHWLRETIELAKRCPPSPTAFSVGAVIVAADGTPLATGFSRERDLRDHAEEVALAKLQADDSRLTSATLYSSLEPCGVRASRPRPCADLIIAAGLRRVVYAWHEPPLLAAGGGGEMLRDAGVTVIEVPELADAARAVNIHLTNPHAPDLPNSRHRRPT